MNMVCIKTTKEKFKWQMNNSNNFNAIKCENSYQVSGNFVEKIFFLNAIIILWYRKSTVHFKNIVSLFVA